MPFNTESATHRGSVDDKALPSFSIIVPVGATLGLLWYQYRHFSYLHPLLSFLIQGLLSLRPCPSLSFPLALVFLKEQRQALESPSSFAPLFPLAGGLVHQLHHCCHLPSTLSLAATCVVPGVNRSGNPAVLDTLPPSLTESTDVDYAWFSKCAKAGQMQKCMQRQTNMLHNSPWTTLHNKKQKQKKTKPQNMIQTTKSTQKFIFLYLLSSCLLKCRFTICWA